MKLKGTQIRKTTISDLRQIYSEGMNESSLQDVNPAFTADNLAELFASENVTALTALRNKKVLGFIIGFLKNNECRIEWIMVKYIFRKKGIGTKMLYLFMENAKNSGAENFFIAVFSNNSESVNFFSKRGFTIKNNILVLSSNSDEKFYPGLT